MDRTAYQNVRIPLMPEMQHTDNGLNEGLAQGLAGIHSRLDIIEDLVLDGQALALGAPITEGSKEILDLALLTLAARRVAVSSLGGFAPPRPGQAPNPFTLLKAAVEMTLSGAADPATALNDLQDAFEYEVTGIRHDITGDGARHDLN